MRKLSMRGAAVVAVLTLALPLVGCGSDEEQAASQTAESSQPAAAASESTATETKDPDSTEVESIDLMIEKMKKKNYGCRNWKQTDDVEGATHSGTCNGEDQIMWFADGADVDAKTKELDEAGTAYVYGDNWIVANTKTPTMVRNALRGTAIAGGNAS